MALIEAGDQEGPTTVDSLRELRRVLGPQKFNRLIWNSLVGNQVIIRGEEPRIVVEIVRSLEVRYGGVISMALQKKSTTTTYFHCTFSFFPRMSCQKSAAPLFWTVPLMNRATPATFWALTDPCQSLQTWTRMTLSCWTCASPPLLADPQQHPPPQQTKMVTQRTQLQFIRQTGPPQHLQGQMDSQM